MLLKIILILAVLIFLYNLAIMPRIIGKPKMDIFETKFYAHRGLHQGREIPENSLAAFQKAVSHGYGIEMDVQLTKDLIPVVFHDGSLLRVCGKKGRIKDYTCEELKKFSLYDSKEKIPTLEEALKLVKGQVPLIIEIKVYDRLKPDCSEIDRLLINYQGKYCIESFHTGVLLWYRLHHREVARGQLSTNFRKETGRENPAFWAVHHLMLNFIGRPDFISYNFHYGHTRSKRICCRLFKCRSAAWTIKNEINLKAAGKDFDVFIFEDFLPGENQQYRISKTA